MRLPKKTKRKFKFHDKYHEVARRKNREYYWKNRQACQYKALHPEVKIKEARKILEAQKIE